MVFVMDYAKARRNMVDCQLRTNRVTDSVVLSAMGTLPRDKFVPVEMRAKSYSDSNLKLSPGRSMMAPMVLGKIFQSLEIGCDDIGLVIGSGTGYAAAVMGQMARAVFALEDDATVSAQAGELCTGLGLDNVVPVTGALEGGWPKEAPYDVIFVDGAVEALPDQLFSQLSDGGRLVAVVISGGIGRATRYLKRDGGKSGCVMFDAKAHLLSEFSQPQNFVF
jgi:protein-L-isoaspartate(D-aspartate) O-methyltransferase